MNSILRKRTNRMVLGHLTSVKSGTAITLAGVGGAGLNRRASAQDATPDATPEAPFAAPVDVVNYALTLEHIETVFYRVALKKFDTAAFEELGLDASVREVIEMIADHEKQHVDALTAVVGQLGGEAVEEAEYEFGYSTLEEFLATAAVIEGVGVAAYGGAAQYLQGAPELLTAALTIHGVEARHASFLNLVTGAVPFPESFEAPLTPAEVLEIATPFFVM